MTASLGFLYIFVMFFNSLHVKDNKKPKLPFFPGHPAMVAGALHPQAPCQTSRLAGEGLPMSCQRLSGLRVRSGLAGAKRNVSSS